MKIFPTILFGILVFFTLTNPAISDGTAWQSQPKDMAIFIGHAYERGPDTLYISAYLDYSEDFLEALFEKGWHKVKGRKIEDTNPVEMVIAKNFVDPSDTVIQMTIKDYAVNPKVSEALTKLFKKVHPSAQVN